MVQYWLQGKQNLLIFILSVLGFVHRNMEKPAEPKYNCA